MASSILLLPIVFIWAILLVVYSTAARRDGRAPADDIGVIFLLVLALYTTLPPLLFILRNATYSSSFSNRFQEFEPSTEGTLYLLTIGLGYAIGFGTVYLGMHRRIPQPVAPSTIPYIDRSILRGAIAIIAANLTINLFLISNGTIKTAESYFDQYRQIAELPLALRQLIKIGAGFAGFSKIVLLVALLQRWPRNRTWFFIYLLSILFSFDEDGSRVSVVTGLLSVAIVWHVLVRPISTSLLLPMFAIGLVAFLILGLKRNLASWHALSTLNFNDFSLGEFDSIWANALELLHYRKQNYLNIPFAATFGEFISFVPSQLLPFEKMTLSDWYLDSFHPLYKERGGGLAFGAVSQAVVGGGVLEAVIRGGLVGVISVWLIRRHRSPNVSWWHFPLYVYLVVFCYLSVRDTSFRLLGDVIQIVLPAILAITITSKLFKIGSEQKFCTLDRQ